LDAEAHPGGLDAKLTEDVAEKLDIVENTVRVVSCSMSRYRRVFFPIPDSAMTP